MVSEREFALFVSRNLRLEAVGICNADMAYYVLLFGLVQSALQICTLECAIKNM